MGEKGRAAYEDELERGDSGRMGPKGESSSSRSAGGTEMVPEPEAEEEGPMIPGIRGMVIRWGDVNDEGGSISVRSLGDFGSSTGTSLMGCQSWMVVDVAASVVVDCEIDLSREGTSVGAGDCEADGRDAESDKGDDESQTTCVGVMGVGASDLNVNDYGARSTCDTRHTDTQLTSSSVELMKSNSISLPSRRSPRPRPGRRRRRRSVC